MTDERDSAQDSAQDSGGDAAQLYRDHVEAVCQLVTHLDADELAQVVPGSPEWTVRDVVAHLAGVGSDQLADRTDGAPSPSWTARHVREREGRTPEELAGELQDNAPALAATLDPNPSGGSPAWDIAVHHADLHEALGRGRLPDPLWRPVLDGVMPRLGDLAPAFDSVDRYELFRAVFSRRSRSQLAGWDTGLDQASLDELPVFGPRDDDGVVPGPHS